MRSILLAVAIGLLGTSLAAAADGVVLLGLQDSVTLPPADAAFDWTGMHLGISGGMVGHPIGAGVVDVQGVLLPWDVANGVLPQKHDASSVGGLLGLQGGYTQQFGSFALGLEGDISWSSASQNSRYSMIDPGVLPTPFAGHEIQSTFVSSLDALGTLRVRGGLALGDSLFFGTAGLATGLVHNSYQLGAPTLPYAPDPWGAEGWEWGYVVGVGAEFAVTDNLSLKAEYLHYNLSDSTVTASDNANFGGEQVSYGFANSGHLVRAGLNIRF